MELSGGVRDRPSSYLGYLPAVYREQAFWGRFLKIFEKILSGIDDEVVVNGTPVAGIEETIDGLADFFDPDRAPAEFLPWLAGWVALGLRADWTSDQQRQFIKRIVPLYQFRGTRENLQALLEIYTGLRPRIVEFGGAGFQIGDHSTIGEDSLIGGGRPHYFEVTASLPADASTMERHKAILNALINLEKPAHTHHQLFTSVDAIQIGVRSTIGVDTLLGEITGGS